MMSFYINDQCSNIQRSKPLKKSYDPKIIPFNSKSTLTTENQDEFYHLESNSNKFMKNNQNSCTNFRSKYFGKNPKFLWKAKLKTDLDGHEELMPVNSIKYQNGDHVSHLDETYDKTHHHKSLSCVNNSLNSIKEPVLKINKDNEECESPNQFWISTNAGSKTENQKPKCSPVKELKLLRKDLSSYHISKHKKEELYANPCDTTSLGLGDSTSISNALQRVITEREEENTLNCSDTESKRQEEESYPSKILDSDELDHGDSMGSTMQQKSCDSEISDSGDKDINPFRKCNFSSPENSSNESEYTGQEETLDMCKVEKDKKISKESFKLDSDTLSDDLQKSDNSVSSNQGNLNTKLDIETTNDEMLIQASSSQSEVDKVDGNIQKVNYFVQMHCLKPNIGVPSAEDDDHLAFTEITQSKSTEILSSSKECSFKSKTHNRTTFKALNNHSKENSRQDAGEYEVNPMPVETIFLEVKKEPEAYDDLGIEDCFVQNELEKEKEKEIKTEPPTEIQPIKAEPPDVSETTSVIGLSNTILGKNESPSMQCSKCSFVGDSQSSLIYHLLSHTEAQKKYKCHLCSYSSNSRYNLKSHQLIHNDFKQFKCTQCPYEANNKGNLKYHMLSHNDTKLFQCNHCSYGSNSKYNLKLHMFKHDSIKRFKCTECNYEANNKGNLKYHLLSHSQLKLYQCSECDYGSNSKYNLKIHIWSHSKNKRYSCSRCSYQTNSKSTLLSHEMAHDKIKEFKCSQCDHVAVSRFELKKHTSTHPKDLNPLFKCPDCDYKTKRKRYLKAHALKHSNEKLYKCPNCDFGTNYKNKLNLHSLMHLKQEEPSVCSFCDFETKSRDALEEHLLLHDEYKPFKCSECSFAANQKDLLVSHLAAH